MLKKSIGLLFCAVSILATPIPTCAQSNANSRKDIEKNTICSFINANNVNIRQKPDPNSAIVAKLNRGDLVRAVKRQGNWVSIAAREFERRSNPYTPLRGYVSNRFINGCSEDQFDRWRQ